MSKSDAHTRNAALTFRVERTEYAEIEVDVPGLLEEWKDERREPEMTDAAFVQDVLWKIGAQDLMYSGDFIRVLDRDTEEEIRSA